MPTPSVHPDSLYTFEQLSGGPLDGVARLHPEAEYIAPPPDPRAPRKPGRPDLYPWDSIPVGRWFRPKPGVQYQSILIAVTRENRKGNNGRVVQPGSPEDAAAARGRLFAVEWEPGVGSVIWRVR